MKTLKQILSLSGAVPLVVQLLFTWFAYSFTSMLSVVGGLDPDGNVVAHTFLDWLMASPGSVLLYVYLILSFLFFHFSFRQVGRIRWRWRILAGAAVSLVFFGMVWAVSYPVLSYQQPKQYQHVSREADNPMGERMQEQMAAISTALASMPWPVAGQLDSRKEQEGLFDPQFYFTVFTNLSLEAGFELDYTYDREGYSGFPELCIREKDAPNTSRRNTAKWYSKIHLNGSPESYLEYALLYLYANQFYISDYALPYAEGGVIATCSAYEKLINEASSLSPWALKAACHVDFLPQVLVGEDRVFVSFATVSAEEGLVLKTLVVSKEFPHRIVSLDPQPLISHDFLLPLAVTKTTAVTQ